MRSRPDHRMTTAYIDVYPRRCKACGDCVEACRKNVLGIVGFLGHKHVKVYRPEDCRGCGTCAATCPHGAIVMKEARLAHLDPAEHTGRAAAHRRTRAGV
jgi:2-oxoglutarate ferredoxin oxidoreductase subunit delta